MGNGNNGHSKRKTFSTDGKRKRESNLEADLTAKAMAVILEHMGMVHKKVKILQQYQQPQRRKWVNKGTFV